MTRTLAATNGELLWPGPNRKLPISLNKRQSEEAAAEGAALPDGAGTRKTAVDVARGGNVVLPD